MPAPHESLVRRVAAFPAGLPLGLRWTAVAVSVAALFYLSLTPSDALPSVSMTDKVQHALGFFCLTLAYGLMFPRARTAVTAGVVCLGVAVEVLQAIMPFGRSAELGDLIADAVGIVAGLVLVRLLAGPARLPT